MWLSKRIGFPFELCKSFLVNGKLFTISVTVLVSSTFESPLVLADNRVFDLVSSLE